MTDGHGSLVSGRCGPHFAGDLRSDVLNRAAVAGDDLAGSERAAGYRQGFGAALRTVAMAFGLTDPGGVLDRWRVVRGPEEMQGRSRLPTTDN